jgi:hypothetical protein
MSGPARCSLRQPLDEWPLGWVGASGPPHPRHDPAAKVVLDRTQGSSASTRRQLEVLGPSWAAIAVRVLGRWSGEGLGLQAVELGLVDGARIQQLLGLGDLLGGGGGGVTGGDGSDVAFELVLGLLLAGRGPLGHPLAPSEE